MSRRDELMAKTAGIRSISDIPDTEVETSAHVPRSGQGSYARRQALEDRIAELEAKLGEFESMSLPVNAISPNPWQPRTIFDADEIKKLSESIAEVGLIQPVIVRRKSVPSGDTSPNSKDGQVQVHKVSPEGTLYELVAGERRLRAHKLLALESIKALVIEASDNDMAVLSLTENIDRQELADWEIAKAIQRVEKEFPSRKRLAEALGIGRNEMYRYISFFTLPGYILADLDINPKLISRHSAEAISTVLKNNARATKELQTIWVEVKSGDIDHPRIANAIKSAMLSAEKGDSRPVNTLLFVGKVKAGSIFRDANKFQVTIKATALTEDKEKRLREFVEVLLKEIPEELK